MSIFLRGACALLLSAGVASGAQAQSSGRAQSNSQKAEVANFESDATFSDSIQLVSCDCGPTVGDDCGGCDLGYCDAGSGGGLGGQFFVGAEWLNVRANFSEATAYREYSLENDLETFHQFDMDYGSSYRVFGGYRFCNCGSEIRFTYTNFNSDGGFTSPPTPNLINDGTTYYAPYELALGDGDVVYGRARVNVDNYDIGFSKTIPLGCPLSCGGCGDCGDCCDSCSGPTCAAWDITWGGGIRFASVDSSLAYGTVRATGSNVPARSAVSSVNFDGAGLRFGLTGRRYFGRTGILSAYVRGDISLLLGDVKYGVAADPAFTDVAISTTEVIPVTEIEAGLTGYITQNISVSGGYLLSAWHDLGHRAEYLYSNSPTQVTGMDDANMMMFDGFFIRAMAAF